jgi:predicted RNA-binding protein
MCASSVYLVDREGRENLIFQDVDKITPSAEGVLLEDIYFKTMTVKARIKEMALVDHRIVLEEIGG